MAKVSAPSAIVPSSYIVPLPREKRWFSPQEAASYIGATPQYFRNLCDGGKIFAHTLMNASNKGKNPETRVHYRIPRASLLMHQAATANYTPPDYLESLAEALTSRTPEERAWLRKFL